MVGPSGLAASARGNRTRPGVAPRDWRGPLLDGRSVRAVLKCQHCDDVIFAVDATYFVVHLTWIGKTQEPPSPRASSLGGLPETQVYLAAHADEAGF